MTTSSVLWVFFLSLLPVSELRGAIFVGITAFKLPVIVVFVAAVSANLLVAPVMFFFLDYVHHYLLPIRLYKTLFGRFVERTKKRAQSRISKYGYYGLAMFVSVPLPVTGAFTGTLAAWLFGMDRRRSLIAISFGVLVAGGIVTTATLIGTGAWMLFVNSAIVKSVG